MKKYVQPVLFLALIIFVALYTACQKQPNYDEANSEIVDSYKFSKRLTLKDQSNENWVIIEAQSDDEAAISEINEEHFELKLFSDDDLKSAFNHSDAGEIHEHNDVSPTPELKLQGDFKIIQSHAKSGYHVAVAFNPKKQQGVSSLQSRGIIFWGDWTWTNDCNLGILALPLGFPNSSYNLFTEHWSKSCWAWDWGVRHCYRWQGFFISGAIQGKQVKIRCFHTCGWSYCNPGAPWIISISGGNHN